MGTGLIIKRAYRRKDKKRTTARTGPSGKKVVMRMWMAILLASISSAALAQQLPVLKRLPEPPEQPIPFSHRLHVSNGLKCGECHPTPDPGDFAEIVGTEKCMACHIAIKTDSPMIQKLARFHKEGVEVPWEPVYVVADYVFFNHRAHTKKAGAECQDCHGPVEQRDVLRKERDISMAACMNCHRARSGSLECNYCHEPR